MSILLKRISDLEKENANLDYMLEMCNGRIEELEAENKRLREALEKARHYLSKVDCYRENIADEADYFWKVKIDEVLNGGKKNDEGRLD